MVRIAVCDDNSFSRELLHDSLLEYRSDRGLDLTVDCFASSGELLTHVKNGEKYDIYFLDIVMPEMNGIEAGSVIRQMKDDGKIIYVSASNEFGVSSYEVDALYYMLKPLDVKKLYAKLDEIFGDMKLKRAFLYIKTPDGTPKVAVRDIMYISQTNRIPQYHLKNGTVVSGVTLRKPFYEVFKDICESEDFGMVNATTVVNFSNVSSMDGECLITKAGEPLYPSRSYNTLVRKKWKAYCER